MKRLTTAVATTALRLDTKTCGLFDINVTSEADGKVTLVTDDMAAVNSDLMSLCGGDIIEKSLAEANIFDLPTPEVGLDDLPFNFGEEFMDLSDFLLGGNNESAALSAMSNKDLFLGAPFAPTSSLPAPKYSSKKKRPASEMETEDSVFSSTIDHCDYTKKRPRFSESTSEMSDSDAESTVSSVSYQSMSLTSAERKVQRRIKNNIASRRSRETRKQKFSAMEEEALELERKNKELTQKVMELETLAKQMKAVLVKRLATSPALN